jgi:hypothetical protein
VPHGGRGRLFGNPRRAAEIRAQRLQFGAEHEDITERRPIKRLDAEPVAGEGERTRLSKILPVPAHREGKNCRDRNQSRAAR